jgi:hypothetical protein
LNEANKYKYALNPYPELPISPSLQEDTMAPKFSVILSLALLFALAGCGTEPEHVSVFERSVVADSSGSQDWDPSEVEELVDDGNLQPEQVQEKTLFQAVLDNSDIPERALRNAFEYFDENHRDIPNKDWITVFDIGQHSGSKRFYVINMKTGDVLATVSAHGVNSDQNNDGYATWFSNTNNSRQSSLGFMLTAETYYGKYGYSMRLDGLESRNSRVRPRAIVVHGADYVAEGMSKVGRSWGCPALDWDVKDLIINRIHGGSLFYSFHSDHD